MTCEGELKNDTSGMPRLALPSGQNTDSITL